MIGFGQVYIPDANFKAYLVGNSAINTNGDSEIQVSEANLFNDTIECYGMNISDLTGIEAFTDLTYLWCYGNQLTSLDVTQNTALTDLNCWDNQLTSLDVTLNTNLTDLHCWDNQLTSLDVTQNTSLTELNCSDNQITSLDVSQNTALAHLICNDSQLTSLGLSQNTMLSTLNCDNTQLTSLDVSANTALWGLMCSNNLLTSLDVSANTALTILVCNSNQLTSLDLRNGNNNMLWWNSGSPIPGISVSNNPYLNCINVDDSSYCNSNWLSEMDPQHYYSNNCPPSAIEEKTTDKEILKVTDLLGRETKQTNQPLFYIYDDGTVEKRIVIE